MSFAAGTKLGRYEIRSKPGEGGMGEVYLAEDTRLHRKVALKILPADVATNRGSEQIQFAIFPVDGSEPIRRIKAAADATDIEWSPDGRAIDFIANRGVANIWRLPVDGGAEKQITQWKTDAPLYWFDWSPDGKRMAVVRDNSTTDVVLIQNFR